MDRPVMLYRAADAIEAAMLRHALEDEGIPVRTSGELGHFMFGELGADALRVELWIPRELAVRGRQVVEAFFAHASLAEPASAGAWACSVCGATNDALRATCSGCEAERGPRPE